ncbi:uncharacterized protein LOC131230936 [Magnolia sinica]|uniref:uncharacterized protein LOC131230936 n=1 Tax=Magnolia sinica TaxID=86752 RepID=UPI002657C669|nr:uncharacterized protein LOC131230936 [Magnolia sinica]
MSVSLPLLSHPIASHHESRRIFNRPISHPSPTINVVIWLPPIKAPIPPRALFRRWDLPSGRNLGLGFIPRAAANGGSESSDIAASAAAADGSKGGEEEEARGASTMPSRFRYLTKEAPDRPVRWPWLIVLAFLIYAWRTVLWELTNWKKAVLAIAGFCGYLLKLVLAIIYLFIGDPITSLIRYIETSLYFVRSVYASIVAYAPVQELSVIIMLASTVLAIAEATVPDSVNSQPYILSLAGLIGFWAVGGFIPELLFWLLLSGLFCYSRFAKKRDNVSAALPVAAVAAAVGEPWVRVLAIASYLTLAIFQHSKSSEGNVEVGAPSNRRRLPLPLLFSALAIGIHVAAKWVRYRHLTWKVL